MTNEPHFTNVMTEMNIKIRQCNKNPILNLKSSASNHRYNYFVLNFHLAPAVELKKKKNLYLLFPSSRMKLSEH